VLFLTDHHVVKANWGAEV